MTMTEASRKAMMSSEYDAWATPQAFITYLQAKYNIRFDLDACANDQNYKVDRYFTIDHSCLDHEWNSHHTWLNPPYGKQISVFLDRALDQVHRGYANNVWVLVPARTDTAWAHKLFSSRYCRMVVFYKGRFQFKHPRKSTKEGGAMFPSMLIRLQDTDRSWVTNTQYIELPLDVRGKNG